LTDILIVGAGIAGLLTARELALAGARVTILERNEFPGRESSWAGGGILSPLYPWRYPDSVTRLSRWSQRIYPELCAELRDATGIDPQCLRSGLFIHAPKELTEAHEFPDIAQVRNPRLVKSLLADLERRGVRIHAGTPVEHLEASTESRPVLIAGGRRWHRLLESLQPAPRIRPVRGQMLLFRTRPGLIRHMMLEENRYIIPRKDGRVLFGSTLEETGFEKQTTQAARRELHKIAVSRFPILADFPIEAHWAGLRPGSPGGIPYIGRHPGQEHLFINAGHYRNGVVLGPASARLVAELVLGREPILDPAFYGFRAARES